jgi:hypothetical protein
MPTGLQAETSRHELTPAEQARAELRRLRDRQLVLPEMMREAAQRGSVDAVFRLRLEMDQLPIRIWAAAYCEVHAELAAYAVTARGQRDRHSLLERATQLAQEARLGR